VKLSPLYAIADRATLDAHGISVAVFATTLAASGATLLQYRDKSGSPQQVLRAARDITTAFVTRAATLVMNDRADLSTLAGWRSVHVGQEDLPIAAARSILGRGSFVGISTHTDEQIVAADALAPDYIAIGPVFATSTKPDASPVIGLEGVRRARALTKRPLVAIGGITRHNAPDVLAAGADSVAVISGLFDPALKLRASVEDFLHRLR
jgi:thiamine-phosphate pyrophosphorylase